MVRTRDQAREARAAALASGPGGLSAVAIAARMGVSERTVRRWLASAQVELRPGLRPSPREARRPPLSTAEADALRRLWQSLPPPSRGGAGHDLACAEGRLLVARLTALRRSGIPAAELGRALGVSGSYARRITGSSGG